MASFSGPEIANDGLVFYYDMANVKKSWKGKPTVNDLSNPDFGSGTTGWVLSSRGTSTHNDVFTVKEEDGIPYLNIHWERHTGTGNSWANIRNSVRYTSAIEYTYSGQFRLNYITGSNPQIRHSAVTNDYWTPGKPVRNISAADIGKGWQDFSLTRTFLSTYTRTSDQVQFNLSGVFEIYSGSQPNTGDVVDFDIRLIQVENNSFASPFVNGTRSNTEAIRDLSGLGSTITPANLSYTSNNTFEFDGTNNYLDLPNSIGYTTQVSAFAWFRHKGTPSGNYHIVCGGQELEISIHTDGYLRTGVQTSGGRFVSNHGTGLVDGNWHHVGFTYDGSTKTAYIDGEPVGTYSVTGTLTNSFANRRIGRFGSSTSYYLNGDLDVYMVYDRPLSPSEVKNNFESKRERYGL